MLRPWKLKIELQVNSTKAIYMQLADAIIADIKKGKLKAGTALPGSRALATDLKLNRNTVVEALNHLLIEGWLISKARSGTFVSGTIPTSGRSIRNRELHPEPPPGSHRPHIIFDDGFPDSRIAPVTELARAYRQIFNRKARWQLLGYAGESGDPELRKALANMLNHQRGMKVNESELCITRGSQMAMYLAAHSLLANGDCVVVENPGYMPAWKAFETAGATLLPVGVDEEGLITVQLSRILESGQPVAAVYTTPHHQYPTTVTMSMARRFELIRLSNQYGFTIIEDDYDNEFHFGQRPLLPLSSFEETERYVYIGTLSKVVAPALRIGYVTSNNSGLMSKVAGLRKIIDVQGDSIMEQAILQLLDDGTIRRHLRKATSHYLSKRSIMDELLKKHLKGKVKYVLPTGGLAFWIVPIKQPDWPGLTARLLVSGVQIINPETYSFGMPVNGMRIGYASLPQKSLDEGLRVLAQHL